MSISAINEGGGRFTFTISGRFTKADKDLIDQGERRLPKDVAGLRILLYLRDFKGWEAGTDAMSLDAFVARDQKIEKLAVVGDEKWKDSMMVFLGAGYRQAQVKFFPPAAIVAANAWLAAP
jgi:hypothetical protein